MEFLFKFLVIINIINLSYQQIIEVDFIRKIRNTTQKNKYNNKYKDFFNINKNNHLSFLEDINKYIHQSQNGEDLGVLINKYNQIILQIKVGSNKQLSNVLVDTGSNVLWIAGKNCTTCEGIKNKFDSSLSKSYRNTSVPMKIEYVTGSTEGFLGFDDFYLGKTQLQNLKFLLSYSTGNEVMESDGILGLGNNYYYKSDTLSLIDQLFIQKKISKRVFTIKINPNNDEGILSIGDIPEEIKNNNRNITNKNYGKCAAVKKSEYGNPNIYWECILDQLYFGDDINKSLTINQKVNFDSGTNIIIVPLFFMKNYILSEYLGKYLQKKICIILPDQFFASIICDKSLDYENLPNINFRFGEYVFFLKPKEIFIENEEYLEFVITSSLNESFDDLWILGEPIFKKMSILFDKDNQEIGFFGYDVQNVGELKKRFNLPWLDIVIIFSITILIVVFVYFIRKYIQNKNEQNMMNYQRFEIIGRNQERINTDF
jgi:hypothetical protein